MELVNFVNTEVGAILHNELTNKGYLIIELDTTGLININDVYKKFLDVFPIGIPLSGVLNWDAFLDACWEAIVNQDQKNIAVFWKGSEKSVTEKLSTFVTIMGILTSLSLSLANDPPFGYSLIIYLVGDGKNYS